MALRSAQRQHRHVVTFEAAGVINGVAICIYEPAIGRLLSARAIHIDFATGRHTGGHVEHEGRTVGCGCAEGNGIGRQTPIRSAKGGGESPATIEHEQANAVALSRFGGIIAQATDVTGAVNCYGANGVFEGAIGSHLHGFVGDDNADGALCIDDG